MGVKWDGREKHIRALVHLSHCIHRRACIHLLTQMSECWNCWLSVRHLFNLKARKILESPPFLSMSMESSWGMQFWSNSSSQKKGFKFLHNFCWRHPPYWIDDEIRFVELRMHFAAAGDSSREENPHTHGFLNTHREFQNVTILTYPFRKVNKSGKWRYFNGGWNVVSVFRFCGKDLSFCNSNATPASSFKPCVFNPRPLRMSLS